MAEKSKRKLLFITVLLIVLLSSSAYVAQIHDALAADASLQQKGLAILSDAVGLDIARYEINAKEYPQDSYFGGVPQENIGYTLESDESKLKLLCTFTNSALQILHVLEREGTPHTTRTTANVLETAREFLNSYQSYSGNAFYGELAAMLNAADANKNLTKTAVNVKLEITTAGEYAIFEWSYTFNGVNAASKCVALGYKNGFLKYFIDTWNLYKIGSTSVNLSESEAINIAVERAKTFSWKVASGNETFEINRFNVTGAVVKQLVFSSSFNADNPRGGDVLTLYPRWRIGVGLDKFYPGNVYGIYVDIWADTKEVRRVQAAFTTLDPEFLGFPPYDESTINTTSDQAPVDTLQSNSSALPQIMLSVFASAVLGIIPIWLRRRKRRLWLSRLPRLRWSRRLLPLILMFSFMLLILVPLVKAFPEPNGCATIWGSLATYKKPDEIALQDQICQDINSAFNSNGYFSSDYQGSYTLKSNALSSISSNETNYHRVATVWFDHGIGHKLSFGPGHEDEWHFMLCDSTTQNEDPMDGYIYDYEIYERTGLGKTFFAFISTCMSAKLDLLVDGQPLGNGTYGYNNGIPIGMPYAWTHGASMSTDGYANPDSGSFCYIGFPWGSAALVLDDLDLAYPNVRYYDWVRNFSYYALNYDMSVNNALDQASYTCFKKYFGSTALHLNFTTCWPAYQGDNATWPNCTMVVYGNGNIHLYQHDFTVNDVDQSANPLLNKDVYIDLPYNIANTGAALKVNGGDHSVFVNDFWEAGYTGYRYTYQYYTYDQTTVYPNPLEWPFSSDWTLTAHFNKQYRPCDINGDGYLNNDDWLIFTSSYPSARGDDTYNYDSRCDFNNDGYVNYGDYLYLMAIVYNVPRRVTVNAYDVEGTPMTENVYVNSYYVDKTGNSFVVPASSHWIGVSVPAGHAFVNFTWAGGSSANNPASIGISSDITVNAYFDEAHYWLTVNASGNYHPYLPAPVSIDGGAWTGVAGDSFWVQEGYHSIEVPQYGYYQGVTYQFYTFQGYSGENPLYILVDEDKEVTALYWGSY